MVFGPVYVLICFSRSGLSFVGVVLSAQYLKKTRSTCQHACGFLFFVFFCDVSSFVACSNYRNLFECTDVTADALFRGWRTLVRERVVQLSQT